MVEHGVSYPRDSHFSDKCIKHIYMADFKFRESGLDAQLTKQVGDDILRLDWTHGAAARCGRKNLLNIMDGAGNILLTKLTHSAEPFSAKYYIHDLLQRGVEPKLAYVDKDCCGAWASVLKTAWPNIHIRLDSMHAIKRLTQTTTSTQHPLHGSFCAELSKSIFSADATILQRLRKAWSQQHGVKKKLPKSVERKIVPRCVRESAAIVASVEQVLSTFAQLPNTAGGLLTEATKEAWQNLKTHVLNGCLQDPPAMNMYVRDHEITIGGEKFHALRSLRGTSHVEGLHAHQKQWLGIFAHHTTEVGEALLKDGACRWNRDKLKRTSVDADADGANSDR